MQISYVGQYNKNAGQPVGTPVPSTAVTSLTAAVRELVPGSIFEGNIAFVKGSNVILSLENGQNVHARLDKNALKLVQGQSMFFQVKSNEDGVVAIRPYMGTGTSNPTLMRALQAAGLPIDDRNLQMVDAMMREQMPIHADALAEMHRAVVGNEGVGVDTLVQMRKLDLPITPQMATQFENYRNDTHMLLGQMNDLMEALPQFLESQSMDLSQMVQMNSQLFGILSEGMTDGTDAAILADADRVQQMMDAEGAAGITAPDAAEGEVEGMFFDSEAADAQPLVRYAPQQLGAVLDPQMQESFSDLLRSIGDLADNENVFDEDGDLNLNLTARKMLSLIDGELQAQLAKGGLEADDVKELFSHKGYQKLLNNVMEEQWLVRPSDVKSKAKISDLYERLERQMEDISKVLRLTGNENSALGRSVDQIRGNVEFMNQVNQIYNYVQIPLKMSGQNANGDLYVYTNKRRARGENDELSAFLHLDMEHLGSTDVSVKMKGKSVDTNFSFSDDESYALVEKYLPILDAKLSALGYNVALTVSGDKGKVDFVEDFLKKDLPGAGSTGVVHRYSFDVRA